MRTFLCDISLCKCVRSVGLDLQSSVIQRPVEYENELQSLPTWIYTDYREYNIKLFTFKIHKVKSLTQVTTTYLFLDVCLCSYIELCLLGSCALCMGCVYWSRGRYILWLTQSQWYELYFGSYWTAVLSGNFLAWCLGRSGVCYVHILFCVAVKKRGKWTNLLSF